MDHRALAGVLLLLAAITLAGCRGGDTATPSPEPTPVLAPTATATPTPEPAPTLAPTATAPAADPYAESTVFVERVMAVMGAYSDISEGAALVNRWTPSLRLRAYETGSGQGIAELSMGCFSGNILLEVAWDATQDRAPTPLGWILHDPVEVRLTWDGGEPVEVQWSRLATQHHDAPKYVLQPWWEKESRWRDQFIGNLIKYEHLQIDSEAIWVEGLPWMTAKFVLLGFSEVYEPFKAMCESIGRRP